MDLNKKVIESFKKIHGDLYDYSLFIQHYKPVLGFGGEFEFNEVVKRDKIKFDFCKLNNINLLVIRYNDRRNRGNITKLFRIVILTHLLYFLLNLDLYIQNLSKFVLKKHLH